MNGAARRSPIMWMRMEYAVFISLNIVSICAPGNLAGDARARFVALSWQDEAHITALTVSVKRAIYGFRNYFALILPESKLSHFGTIAKLLKLNIDQFGASIAI